MESFAFPDEFMRKLKMKKMTFFQHCQTEHFLSNSVKIEKLLVKKNHLDTKLWTTLRSPWKA